MKLNELADEIFQVNEEKGFHDPKIYNETNAIALIASEAFEMLEAERSGRYADLQKFEERNIYPIFNDSAFADYIKDTVEDELADVVIRLCDFYEKYHYKIPQICGNYEFIGSTGYFALVISSECCKYVEGGTLWDFEEIFNYCFSYAKQLNIDLLKFIELKVKYNKTRPKLHGKKF